MGLVNRKLLDCTPWKQAGATNARTKSNSSSVLEKRMSSAIRIRTPSASTSSSPAKALAQDTVCKNIQIYGTCRFKDTTCQYLHPPPNPDFVGTTPASPSRLSATSTPFSIGSSTLKAAAGAAIFVPGGSAVQSGASTPSGAGLGGASVQEFVPSMAFKLPGGAGGASNGNGAGVGMFGASGLDSPRREGTPALSEDMAFFSPPSSTSHKVAHPPPSVGMSVDYESSGIHGANQGRELTEYFQGMEVTGSEYGSSGYPQRHQNRDEALAMYEYNQHQQLLNGFGAAPTGANEASGNYYLHLQQQHGHGGNGGPLAFSRQPLQYHLYHPINPSPQPHSFFLPPSLHTLLTQKSEATHAVPSIDMKLPEEVGGYGSLLPLDKGQEGSGTMGFRCWCYKAKKRGDGKEGGRVVVLRRIEGFRLQHEAAIGVVDKWTRVRHPNLVGVKEAFTSRAFGDHSVIFVYDFHPTAITLYEAHLTLPPPSTSSNPWTVAPPLSLHQHSHHYSQQSSHRHRSAPLHSSAEIPVSGVPERVLWSYIVQLSSALKTIHAAGLAVRGLESNRVILTGKNRIRISGCGVIDVLGWDGGGIGTGVGGVSGWQQDDLLSFGKLLLSLACGSASATATHNLPKSVDYIARVYSPDLKNLVLYLLSKPGPRKSVEEVLAQLGGRVVEELSASFIAEDTLESELVRELENGRLVRLLAKFGFINERPEFDHDPRWAETGDRYIIKLFRDFVFHQVDENGKPVTDLSHVLSALNKLDAGVEEKIMLISRDEQSCLIVSYREVKNCIESAFLDLTR